MQHDQQRRAWHIAKFGTIYNTLAEVCEISREIIGAALDSV